MIVYALIPNKPNLQPKLVVDQYSLPTNNDYQVVEINLNTKQLLLLGHILLDTLSPTDITNIIQNRLDSDTSENFDLDYMAIHNAIKDYDQPTQI